MGHVMTALTTAPEESLSGNAEEVQNGARLLATVSKVPLGKLFRKLVDLFAIGVFLANVIVQAIDLIGSIQDNQTSSLPYKASALVVGVLENIILIILFLVNRKRRKEGSDPNAEKKNQYIQNIIHELLLYPLIVYNIVGLATEQSWTAFTSLIVPEKGENRTLNLMEQNNIMNATEESPPNPEEQAMEWVQLILLIIDFTELTWTYVVRIYMLYKLLKDVQRILDPEKVNQGCCSWNIAAYILPRAYLTTIGNTILFVFLMIMLGTQVYRDNKHIGE